MRRYLGEAGNDKEWSGARQVADEKVALEGTAIRARRTWVVCELGADVDAGTGHRSEAQWWLKANIVPLVTEIRNADGTVEVKVRPVALLETPLKLIELVVVDQHADHIIALMQEQQVGFGVSDCGETMIGS